MLYRLFQIPARIAFFIWCRKLIINYPNIINSKGPLLIAANHPNSFLDAIVLCSIFKKPIYSLARGDAFKNKIVNKILRSLKMFPVYRVSEGAENLEENYKTFDDCIDVFKQNGIVLIFSEGKCINEWNLRPLKKGTARLAISAWEKNIPLQVIPLGINYNSFTSFGKNIILNFGKNINEKNIEFNKEDVYGTKIQKFNSVLKSELEELVVQSKPKDEAFIRNIFSYDVSVLKKILLFLPAVFAYIIHAPLYTPIQKFAFKKFSKIDHYDSVVVGLLFLLYPLYLFFISFIGFILGGSWWISVFFILPATAWSFVAIKKQF